MPVMDGIALALAAARDFPDLTILLMTGFADQRERASGLNAIVHDVITKPFSVADIRAAVADALAARKSGSGARHCQLVIAERDPAIHLLEGLCEDDGYAGQARV